MSKFLELSIATAALVAFATGAAASDKLGLGRAALPEEIAAWDHDIGPAATELPEGSGSVEDGEMLFAEHCAVCHGDFAEGVGNWPKLAGGMGTLADKDPLKTVGSYWPYLSTTWDYVNRSMPFGNAQSLSADDVYAMVAYILYSNDLIEDDFVLSHENFLDVEMPNAGNFIVDDRAETEYPKFTEANACMENCKNSVEITMRAAVLDVTPDEEGGDEATEESTEANVDSTENANEESVKTTKEEPASKTAEATTEDTAPSAELDATLVVAGEKVFKKCKACHQVGEGAKNRSGPILNDTVGRTIGSVDGFKYSKVLSEMGAEGMVWDEENLAAFLAKPKSFAKGTKMSFAGLKKEADQQAIIEYLKSYSTK